MATKPVRPDNSIPIEIGNKYAVKPGAMAGDWLEIVDIQNGYVWAKGLENHIAAWIVPVWKFDDLVQEYTEGAYVLETENSLFQLATENNEVILFA